MSLTALCQITRLQHLHHGTSTLNLIRMTTVLDECLSVLMFGSKNSRFLESGTTASVHPGILESAVHISDTGIIGFTDPFWLTDGLAD